VVRSRQPQGQQGQRPAQAPSARRRRRSAGPDAAAPRPGQQPPTAVIGIVDVPEIQRVSTAFTQVRDAIEQRRAG